MRIKQNLFLFSPVRHVSPTYLLCNKFDLKKKKKKGIVNICFECKLHTFHLNFEENGSVYRLLDSDSR